MARDDVEADAAGISWQLSSTPRLLPHYTHLHTGAACVLPFLALPPAVLRERAYKATEQQSLFGMVFPPGAANISLVNMDHLCRLKTLHKCVALIAWSQSHDAGGSK